MEQGSGFISGGSKNGKSKVSTLIILLGILYVLFLLYQSVYFNYQRSQNIKSIKEEIVALEGKQRKIEALIAYYKTDSFQELEARKKLGLKMPGEIVVKVDVKNQEKNYLEANHQKQDSQPKQKTNIELWGDFLAGRLNGF